MGCDEQIGDYSMSEIGSLSISELELLVLVSGVSRDQLDAIRPYFPDSTYRNILLRVLTGFQNGNHT